MITHTIPGNFQQLEIIQLLWLSGEKELLLNGFDKSKMELTHLKLYDWKSVDETQNH